MGETLRIVSLERHGEIAWSPSDQKLRGPGSGKLLRYHRHDPRRRPESSVSGPLQPCHGLWEGRVDHVVSGEVTHFHTIEELLVFMPRPRRLADAGPRARQFVPVPAHIVPSCGPSRAAFRSGGRSGAAAARVSRAGTLLEYLAHPGATHGRRFARTTR